MSDVTIIPADDAEAGQKAEWMAKSEAEVAPQVMSDPVGVEAAVVPVAAEREIDFTEGFTHYRAILSAHFPSVASAEQVAAAIQGSALPEGSYLQMYHADNPNVETKLAPGEVILLLQFGDGEYDHAAFEQLAAEAGGTNIHYTPPQKVANTGFNEG